MRFSSDNNGLLTEHVPDSVKITVGAAGTGAGFLFEYAGSFAALGTAAFMALSFAEKLLKMRREYLDTKPKAKSESDTKQNS